MRTHTFVLTAALLLAAVPRAAQSQTQPSPVPGVAAHPARDIVLDGKLDEGVWATPEPATGFRQQQPREGEPAQRTEVRFAYDESALYIGARMFDSLGAAGVNTQLTRRDQSVESDYLQLVFDTYHDHAGRTVLQVNPSGVKYDAGQASPSADPSWDPVWTVQTRIDSAGWTAEMRIPWNQLRFSNAVEQTWGLQVLRYVQRLNESSLWSFYGRQESGGPARYGHLSGMRIENRPRGLEIMPYAVARASYVEPTQSGSPFQEARAYDTRVGADVRALLGSNLTLSATINPDFGQVEQDPAVVNLSAFESYFDEKRPFFVEGSGLLSFGGLNCFTCSNVSGMSLFYSRRIGRAPQGGLPGGYDYQDAPANTRLLGAAKLTGRTAGGWQIGAVEAVTAREVGYVRNADGTGQETTVEPFTNYLMGRVKRTSGGGSRTWGLMGTSVVRRFGDDGQALRGQLATHAEAVGADWNLYWKNQTYRLMGNVALSNVMGDSLAIRRLQRSSARYFQRPDRDGGGNGIFSDAYATDATALRGFGGYMRMSKESGAWMWETSTNYRSPGFEVNDMAFLTQADYVWMNANLVRNVTTPSNWYRSMWISGGGQQQYNFDGDRTDLQFHQYSEVNLLNNWDLSLYGHVRPEVNTDRMTRGGPVVRRAASWFLNPSINTDSRQRVVFSLGGGFGGTANGGGVTEINGSIRVKPATNVQISVGPSYTHERDPSQFVARFTDANATDFMGQRVVFAELDQHVVSMNTRINWTFTPTMTLELFAQPFVATGDYSDYKEFVRPRTVRTRDFSDQELTVTDRDAGGRPLRYRLDTDGNPATDEGFRFDNGGFNVRSLRGNAVLRWEYRPGSTLFFVWQQQRSGSQPYGEFDFGRDASAVFRSHADNVFVIKATYWIGG
ncbi:DUF5916 domain-containing protein [Longimicrobium terrae]|uniref:Carbohydrate binding family 9 domain-containing protein n=1 Tax=Longimicrobium terrae TaxID=1639882 RepID=A0A841H248_9BACT|nr:DUF5916 domain-containing protein [Longimicrobium terrae]MBB4637968.1 hypothetical protein [Longimicrobium terrae]MBB6072215.1 hypothetical protein [Longimicrobium terrae]NNC28359.1 carbohydrate binding family 9 domain-containing protein [Longimicrobium terrae]